jgi:hypothetical protein
MVRGLRETRVLKQGGRGRPLPCYLCHPFMPQVLSYPYRRAKGESFYHPLIPPVLCCQLGDWGDVDPFGCLPALLGNPTSTTKNAGSRFLAIGFMPIFSLT